MRKRIVSFCLVILMFYAMLPQITVSVRAYSNAYNLPDLTGNTAHDVANIAKSQVGYTFDNGTIYGEWWNSVTNWGVDYTKSPWCGMFACWCANQAGVGLNVAYDKNSAGVSYLLNWIKNNASYDLSFSSYPQIGDYIFFGDSAGNPGHVAIVTGYNSNTRTVSFVGGNQGGAVTSETCSWTNGSKWGSQYVLGYGRPGYCEHTYNDIGVCSKCDTEYIWQTTYDTSCAGTYTVTLSTGIYLRTDKPYTASTAKSDKIKAGIDVKVHGSVKNAHDHVWYLVAYEGIVGYTSADNLTFKSYGEQEISCTLSSPAEGATVPKSSYPVIGTITSKYPLQEVIAKIDGSEYATVTLGNTTSLDIRPSDINYLLDFSSLAPGNHTLVIKARDIHHSDWVTVCTRHFITEGVVECEHSYTSQMTKSSTCLEDGIWTYTCTKCGSSYEEPIPATGYHCWGAWGVTKEATCTQKGTRERRCAVCWELESETIPITDHKYGVWETVQNATCTEEGIQQRVCTGCAVTQTQSVEAKGHSYGSWVTITTATCTTGGLKQRICSLCNQVEIETIEATGHRYISITVEPQCETQGYTQYGCYYCSDYYEDSYVPAKGHQYEDGVCTSCGEADPDAVIKGDLDGDGEVTAADAVLLARYLADLIELDEKQLKAADIDDDGEITSADSVILARFLAGLIDKLEDLEE